MCLVLRGACLLDSNFHPVLYAASGHSIHSNGTETHLICETRLTDLICYWYSHKKKHRIHTMGEIHFVLKLCVSQMCSYQEFHNEEWTKVYMKQKGRGVVQGPHVGVLICSAWCMLTSGYKSRKSHFPACFKCSKNAASVALCYSHWERCLYCDNYHQGILMRSAFVTQKLIIA